jgi:hypothetical protein
MPGVTAVTAPEGTPAKRPTGTDGNPVANEEARHQLEAESDR